jgi:uncharacterized OB-fold protein
MSLFFGACQNNPKTESIENKDTTAIETISETKVTSVPFTLLKNYFVKNDIQKLDNPKIETQEKFNEIFGMGATMGKEGKPTAMDFNKQYVIAVILPETDTMITVELVSLTKEENGNIILTFKTEVGQKQSFTTRPNFGILVDKTEVGKIELKEQK